MFDFVTGQPGDELHVNLERIPIENVPVDKEELKM
jgi:hypothetical protein